MKYENDFSFSQLSNNSDGKTSASGLLGLISGFAGVLSFLYGVIDYSLISKNGTIMTQSIVVLTIGAGLLGYRKSRESSILNNTINAGIPTETLPTPPVTVDTTTNVTTNVTTDTP